MSLAPDAPALQAALLDWYDRNRRRLPWRALPGERADPYRVWLSEIMLQQTTVAAVGPYFERFTETWPTVRALAAAPLDSVLTAWAGLGYYARARNLHACAQRVVDRHDGVFPEDEDALRDLPGVGEYTAAAIAAIAFDRPAMPVDGNIERVVARLRAIETPLPEGKKDIKAAARALTPDGDFAQAMMDLGSGVCAPKTARCMLCPWRDACAGRRLGEPERLPMKVPKPERPTRFGVAFWAVRGDGSVLLRRRPAKGLLGGMMETPSTPWRDDPWEEGEAKSAAPLALKWRQLPGLVRHTFTHFHLELTVMAGKAPPFAPVTDGIWVSPDAFGDHALPSVMKKVARHAMRKTS